jgi:hypothetical protein
MLVSQRPILPQWSVMFTNKTSHFSYREDVTTVQQYASFIVATVHRQTLQQPMQVPLNCVQNLALIELSVKSS